MMEGRASITVDCTWDILSSTVKMLMIGLFLLDIAAMEKVRLLSLINNALLIQNEGLELDNF